MGNHEDLEPVACALCGGDDPLRITDRGQHGLPTHVVICRHDGLVYLSPRWTAERYGRFYAHEYDSYYRPAVLSGEAAEAKYRTGREILARVRSRLGPGVVEVLDVGAGMGWALEIFKRELGPKTRLAAIEASAHCRENLRDVVGAELVDTDVMGDWPTGNVARFQFASMRHVLEHFLDPVGALRAVAASLATEGRVYLAVPNMMAPLRGLERHWFRAPHVYYFNPTTLAECARLAGLRPVCLETSRAEVWGVFERGAAPSPGAPGATFGDQLGVIRSRLSRDRIRAVLGLPRRIARRIRAGSRSNAQR